MVKKSRGRGYNDSVSCPQTAERVLHSSLDSAGSDSMLQDFPATASNSYLIIINPKFDDFEFITSFRSTSLIHTINVGWPKYEHLLSGLNECVVKHTAAIPKNEDVPHYKKIL